MSFFKKSPIFLKLDKNNVIFINDKKIYLDNWSFTIIQFCEFLNISIPRFCYHDRLSIAGNCRMCMVELKSSLKPVIACATSLMKNMHIYTTTFFVKKARENVLEFLLINHPLDCPICDQGGECDLQDQAVIYGSDRGRFKEIKRSVQDLFMGPVVKTIMTRCIHCTRCIRFSEEIVGDYSLGRLGRGDITEIGTYLKKPFLDELSGNIVDLCPVGALTSRSYAFKARPWELKSIESIDIFDSLGSNIRVDVKGNEIMRILPKRNDFLNEEWITDKIRFSHEGLKKNRLVYPMLRINKNEPLQIYSISFFFSTLFGRLINFYIQHKNNQLEKLVKIELSDYFSSASDYFIIHNFFSFLGINNIEYHSLLSTYINIDFRFNYLLNNNLSSFENSNTYLFNHINLKKENPVLNSRIKKVKMNKGNNITIAYIGSNINLNYDFVHLSNSFFTYFSILEGKHFFSTKIFKKNEFIQIINGLNIYKSNILSNINLKSFLREYNINLSTVLPNSSAVTIADLGYSNSISDHYIINNNNKIYYLYNKELDIHNKDKQLLNYSNADELIFHGTNINEEIKKYTTFLIPSTSFFESKLLFSNNLGYVQSTSQAISLTNNFYSVFSLFLNIDKYLLSYDELLKNIPTKYLFVASIYIQKLYNSKFNIFFPLYNVHSYFKIVDIDVKNLNKNHKISYNYYSDYIIDYYKTDNVSIYSETLQKCSLLLQQSKNNFFKNFTKYEYIL
jgi:NADH dehydrogenase (ubiquinone) Fe-S protein 1